MHILLISIHAPARGATFAADISFAFGYHFNPRSREGSDTVYTGPQRVHPDFNPRSREGSDQCCCDVKQQILEFQSTLPRGERLIFLGWLSRSVTISIHAPARGATSCADTWRTSRTNFNPRSREGSDVSDVLCFSSHADFNPRSREGSDIYITKRR